MVQGHQVYPVSGSVNEARQATKAEIFKRFVVVKNLFRDYEVIAGWYTLAGILGSALWMIQSLTYTALKWGSFSDGLNELVLGAAAILLISFFEEHMRSSVREFNR